MKWYNVLRTIALFIIINLSFFFPSTVTHFDPHTAHDCAAMFYIIAKMQDCSSIEINFSNSGVTGDQIRMLMDLLASKNGILQITELTLDCINLTDSSMNVIEHHLHLVIHLRGSNAVEL